MTQLAKRPVMLIVRDGWGANPLPNSEKTNAIKVANTPTDDKLMAEYPNSLIKTSGEEVGLPAGVMGNSEVGHQNIGAGRIVDQEIMRITRMVRDGSFFKNETLLEAIAHAKTNGGSVHIMGLFSDGRVHSDLGHANALIELCKLQGLASGKLYVHVITDGRDTPPKSARTFVEPLEAKLKEEGVGRIGSVVGRFYAMDRDNRWDRVERAYNLLTKGSDKIMKSAVEAIDEYYANPTGDNQTGDEFILPVSIAPDGKVSEDQKIKAGDAVIFFNYRGDRPREISKAFVLDDAAWGEVPNEGFDRGAKIDNLYFVGLTNYEKGLPLHVAVDKPPKMKNILGEVLADAGLKQFRSAETEKFPHVTFFFNDYREEPFPGESREMCASPKEVATYDQKPEMSAPQVTEIVLKAIETDVHDVYIVNYANGDMVGHTGSIPAAVKAVEAVDEGVGKLVDAILAKGGALIITADHGNCEQMVNPETGAPFTAHTTNDVPLIVVGDGLRGKTLKSGGCLADIAPTMLDLLGLAKPAEMTGDSLLA